MKKVWAIINYEWNCPECDEQTVADEYEIETMKDIEERIVIQCEFCDEVYEVEL